MNIQCTYHGATVNIVDVDVNGHNAYVTYVDATSALQVRVDNISTSAGALAVTLATSATII